MSVSAQWIEHRRGRDRELLGRMAPGATVSWSSICWVAHARRRGIGSPRRKHSLKSDGDSSLIHLSFVSPADAGCQARNTELSPERIRVTRDGWSSSDVEERESSMPVPLPEELRSQTN